MGWLDEFIRRIGGRQGGFTVRMTPEQQVEQALQTQLRQFIPTLDSTLSPPWGNDPSQMREMPTIRLHPINQGSRMPVADPNELMRRSRDRGAGGPA